MLRRMTKYFLILFIMIVGIKDVKAEGYVAKIGNTNYESIADAIAAAGANSEIVLLSDISSFTVPEGKNITISLNNNSIDFSGAISGSIVNNGNVKIVGTGNIICSQYSICIVNNAYISFDHVTINGTSSSQSILTNKGNMEVSNTSITNTGYAKIFNNAVDSTLLVNSGNFEAKGLFSNYGNFNIKGGNFKSAVKSLSNENKGTMNIDGGTFDLTHEIENQRGIINIKGGTFNGKKIAQNYDPNYLSNDSKINSIINIEGGTFNCTSTCFSNASLLYYGIINIKGGIIKSTGTDVVLANYSKNNSIVMTSGSVDAKNSDGILITGESSFTLGSDDGDVKTSIPVINIPNGNIGYLGDNVIVNFYDGYINLKTTLDDSGLITYNVPDNYYIKYDNNSDGSLKAYLSTDSTSSTSSNIEGSKQSSTSNRTVSEVVKVPNTSMNIQLIILAIGLLVAIFGGIIIFKTFFYQEKNVTNK